MAIEEENVGAISDKVEPENVELIHFYNCIYHR